MALMTTMMDSKLTLQRPTTGRDANQGMTQDPVSILTDIPCSCQPASKSVQMIYAQRGMRVSGTIYTYQALNARPNDLIIVTRETGVTEHYQVQGEDQEGGMRERVWSTDVVKIV